MHKKRLRLKRTKRRMSVQNRHSAAVPKAHLKSGTVCFGTVDVQRCPRERSQTSKQLACSAFRQCRPSAIAGLDILLQQTCACELLSCWAVVSLEPNQAFIQQTTCGYQITCTLYSQSQPQLIPNLSPSHPVPNVTCHPSGGRLTQERLLLPLPPLPPLLFLPPPLLPLLCCHFWGTQTRCKSLCYRGAERHPNRGCWWWVVVLLLLH